MREWDGWTKVPQGRVDDPSTWMSLDEVIQGVAAGKADGIGYCLLHSGVGAVDLDKCYNEDTKAIAPWAQAIIDRAPKETYCEITVSGTGLRLIGLASGPPLHRKFKAADGGSFELYRDCARFITVSELAIQGRRWRQRTA